MRPRTEAQALLAEARTYLNTYGDYGPSDLEEFGSYDVAVLDPYDYPDRDFPVRLREAGTVVLAYIDVGEAEECRGYWPEVEKRPEVILAPNPDWPGCHYADVNNPEWRRIILDHEIPHLEPPAPAVAPVAAGAA